jgi:hypothetical protein
LTNGEGSGEELRERGLKGSVGEIERGKKVREGGGRVRFEMGG